MGFIEGTDRAQASLLPACVDDYIASDSLARVVDAFVDSLDLVDLGFTRAVAAATGRPGYHPADMLRLYIWGYLNQVRSSRHLERSCRRDLEVIWLMRQLRPDYRTIAAFRHDNPEAIVRMSAAFITFCRGRRCPRRGAACPNASMRSAALTSGALGPTAPASTTNDAVA